MMYDIEYMAYMNAQIKEAKEKLISEFVNDLKEYDKKIPKTYSIELIKKWEKKLK